MAATATSASSPCALISMVESRGARNAMTFATLLALIQSAVSDARMEIWAWNRLASLVNFTAGRACMPTACTSLTLPVANGPFTEVSSISISNHRFGRLSSAGSQFLGYRPHLLQRAAAGRLGRGHDGALDDRRVADDNHLAPVRLQHFDRHLAVRLGPAQIDQD